MTNFPEDNATPDSDAIEIHLCTLRDGASMDSVKAAEQGFMSANANAAIAVDRWTPLFADTPYDLVYLVAHEDLLQLGSFNTTWSTSAAGQANGAAFNASLNCESGLYTARVIQQGTAD